MYFGPLWSHLVLFGLFCPLWSYSVHFSPLWSYSVDIDSIRSTLVLYGPILVLFSQLWSYSVRFVHLVLFGLTWSTSIHFVPIESFRIFLAHISPIWCHSIIFQFGHIWFTFSLFSPFDPYWFTSFQFGQYWSKSVYFDPIWSYLVHIHISSIYPYFHFHVSLRATNF